MDFKQYNNIYKLYNHNRRGKKGGGLALICKSNLKVKTVDKGATDTMEFAVWSIQIRNKTITVTGIYHPPYSLTNKATNKMFLDDFTKLATNIMPKHQNNLFVGDFNLHVSKDDTDINAAIFSDSTEAIGLYQHVTFPTHNTGNTLDLVLSEINGEASILMTTRCPYVSPTMQ